MSSLGVRKHYTHKYNIQNTHYTHKYNIQNTHKYNIQKKK